MDPILFLDIDGVLNGHTRHGNGHCKIDPKPAKYLNGLLAQFPDLQIVLSTAWRYYVLDGHMTLKGFEGMLLSHGLNVRDRIHGVTDVDPVSFTQWCLDADSSLFDRENDRITEAGIKWWSENGLEWRKDQILAYIQAHDITNYVVVDDLPIPVLRLVQTNKDKGLSIVDELNIGCILVAHGARGNYGEDPEQ